MYLVTGGAGFIGSHIVAELADRGLGGETVIVDDVGWKWRNLAKRAPSRIYPIAKLNDVVMKVKFDAIFHMGAISSTAATDGTALAEVNSTLTADLFGRCRDDGTKFIYASSASVYGHKGVQRASNDIEETKALQPINAYGWSKKLADCAVLADAIRPRMFQQGRGSGPPSWAGLRFFNVFGPNEWHKDGQKSFISECFTSIRHNWKPRVFEGSESFRRDWVRVEDCARLAVEIALADNPHSGIVNVGSGVSTTFLDVARMCMAAAGMDGDPVTIRFPDDKREGYQTFTMSPDDSHSTMPLKGAIKDYWDRYASRDGLDRYR